MYKKRGIHGRSATQGHPTPQLEKVSVAVGYSLYHVQQFTHNLATSLQVSGTDLTAGLAALLSQPPNGQVFRTDERLPQDGMRGDPALGTQIPIAALALDDGSLRNAPHVDMRGRRKMSAAAKRLIGIRMKENWAKRKRLMAKAAKAGNKDKKTKLGNGKPHWTQTPEGRKKQRAMMKKRLATGWRPNRRQPAAAAAAA